MNDYEPWVHLGCTEAEYYKMRYLEARRETFKVAQELEVALFKLAAIKDYHPQECACLECKPCGAV